MNSMFPWHRAAAGSSLGTSGARSPSDSSRRWFAPVAEHDGCSFNSVEATYLLISSSSQHIYGVHIRSDVLLGNIFPWFGFNSSSLLLDMNGAICLYGGISSTEERNADSSLILTARDSHNQYIVLIEFPICHCSHQRQTPGAKNTAGVLTLPRTV